MMANERDKPCPICFQVDRLDAAGKQNHVPRDLDCELCGTHSLTEDAAEYLPSCSFTVEQRALLAHGVAQLPRNAIISRKLIEDLLINRRLPDPSEMIDLLVLWLAEQGAPGFSRNIIPDNIQAVVGAVDHYGAVWTLDETEKLGYLDHSRGDHGPEDLYYYLTSKGWARRSKLLRNGTRSRHAFMAMDFSNRECEKFFRKYLKPAVKSRTDFELRQNRDAHQTAGSIDNTMRVDIRTARFLVCDLTNGNQGAYWEAGFAEGIGRPVFYIRRDKEAYSKSRAKRPHFDVQQQPVIPWNLADPQTAVDKVVAMIRATLPAEAMLQDPPAGET